MGLCDAGRKLGCWRGGRGGRTGSASGSLGPNPPSASSHRQAFWILSALRFSFYPCQGEVTYDNKWLPHWRHSRNDSRFLQCTGLRALWVKSPHMMEGVVPPGSSGFKPLRFCELGSSPPGFWPSECLLVGVEIKALAVTWGNPSSNVFLNTGCTLIGSERNENTAGFSETDKINPWNSVFRTTQTISFYIFKMVAFKIYGK